ncbi:teichoic acid transport system ATP-binding protein [Arthrobacter sp. CAN_A212]|uniref:ABC transporter ATP-binding protein n=1 Tax=Arthrobacter sp. CAN_A212 TaxID=2787719 RepID=UPI001A26FB3D
MTSEIEFVAEQPAVVVDKVSMVYQVQSKEQAAQKGPRLLRPVRRAIGRDTSVKLQALKEVSVVVHHGESVGIIGRNGSGKSTLMKLINGRVPPSSGAVYASARPTLLGVSAALVPDISGEQNIMLGCLAMGMSKADIASKYQSIVELSGLEDSIHLPMKTYSSGMGSRLQFAIATAVDTEILLIDEALNTGDDQFKGRTKQRMNELLTNAGCVFLVSHSLGTIKDMCSRVIWLDEGELVMDGNPDEVIKWYRTFVKHLTARDRVAAMKTKRRVMYDLVVPEVVVRETGRRSTE